MFRVCQTVLYVDCRLVVTNGKGLTFWLSCTCCFPVCLSLSLVVSWVRCGTWLYRFLIFAFFFTFIAVEYFNWCGSDLSVGLDVCSISLESMARFENTASMTSQWDDMQRKGFSRHGSKANFISDVHRFLNPILMSDSQQSLLLWGSTPSHLLRYLSQHTIELSSN